MGTADVHLREVIALFSAALYKWLLDSVTRRCFVWSTGFVLNGGVAGILMLSMPEPVTF